MPNRIPSLDGLRALSILLVIAGHIWRPPNATSSVAAVMIANLGVQIFFVISGYLITTLLQQEQERSQAISLRAFYRRRSFRIFPAAFVYIAVMAVIAPSSHEGLAYALTYTTTWHAIGMPVALSHLWSLSVEEHFYLLWPLALVFAYRRRALIAWTAVGVASASRLAVALVRPAGYFSYIHHAFPCTMDSIAAGCLLAIYLPQLRRALGWMVPQTGIAIALPFVTWSLYAVTFGDTMPALSCLRAAVPLLIALWMFLLVERRYPILDHPILTTIGVASYSIYLWQEPFLALPGRPSLPVGLGCIATCAAASYFLIEKPMIRMGRKGKNENATHGYATGWFGLYPRYSALDTRLAPRSLGR